VTKKVAGKTKDEVGVGDAMKKTAQHAGHDNEKRERRV